MNAAAARCAARGESRAASASPAAGQGNKEGLAVGSTLSRRQLKSLPVVWPRARQSERSERRRCPMASLSRRQPRKVRGQRAH